MACGHGSALDAKRKKDPKATLDISKDPALKVGLAALATTVGKPIGWDGTGAPGADPDGR